MTPKSNSTEYLSGAGKSVYEGMSKADPEAVWVMQGWLFLNSKFWGSDQVEALVTAVPKVSQALSDEVARKLQRKITADRQYRGQATNSVVA